MIIPFLFDCSYLNLFLSSFPPSVYDNIKRRTIRRLHAQKHTLRIVAKQINNIKSNSPSCKSNKGVLNNVGAAFLQKQKTLC